MKALKAAKEVFDFLDRIDTLFDFAESIWLSFDKIRVSWENGADPEFLLDQAEDLSGLISACLEEHSELAKELKDELAKGTFTPDQLAIAGRFFGVIEILLKISDIFTATKSASSDISDLIEQLRGTVAIYDERYSTAKAALERYVGMPDCNEPSGPVVVRPSPQGPGRALSSDSVFLAAEIASALNDPGSPLIELLDSNGAPSATWPSFTPPLSSLAPDRPGVWSVGTERSDFGALGLQVFAPAERIVHCDIIQYRWLFRVRLVRPSQQVRLRVRYLRTDGKRSSKAIVFASVSAGALDHLLPPLSHHLV